MKTNKHESLVGNCPEIIATFLTAFFKTLDEDGIKWAVAHGWEGLPFYARHDVDMIVEKNQLKTIVAILKRVAKEKKWINYCHFKFSNLHSYWLLLPGKQISYFQIDLFTEASMRGISFFSSVRLLENRWKNESGIWCMPYSYAGVIVLLKELIANSCLEREDRHRQVFDGYSKDKEGFVALLHEALRGDTYLTNSVVEMVRAKKWGDLPSLAEAIRQRTMQPKIKDVRGMAIYVFDYLRLCIFPFLRPFVALVGPDGCGKTTIADAVANYFDHRPLCGLMRIHSNFRGTIRLRDIYRKLMSLFGRNVTFEADLPPGTRGMGMKPPLERFRSMFYVLYYGVVLAIGGRLALFRWRTFSGLLLADRYYYDYYYMRGYIKCPKWWKDLVRIIVPEPDLIFVLERSAEEIYSQKPELEIEEIKRQQFEIRHCLGNDRRVSFIDAGHGIDLTVQAVCSKIEKWIMDYGG